MKWVWVGKYKAWRFNEGGRRNWREIERSQVSLLILFPESVGKCELEVHTSGQAFTLFGSGDRSVPASGFAKYGGRRLCIAITIVTQ